MKKRPLQFPAALKNPWVTLKSLLKSSQNIGFCLWQKWGQLPVPFTLTAFCNLTVERLKGNNMRGYLSTSTLHQDMKHGVFILGQGRIIEVIRWRWSSPEQHRLSLSSLCNVLSEALYESSSTVLYRGNVREDMGALSGAFRSLTAGEPATAPLWGKKILLSTVTFSIEKISIFTLCV